MPDPISAARERAIRAAYGVEHQLYQVESATIAQIKAELEIARLRTIATIATAPKDWQIYQAQALLVEIERQLRAWAAVAASIATGRLGEVADLGAEQAVAALQIRLSAPMISRDFVAVAYQTMPWMISGVGDEIIKRVGSVLQQAVLAQQTPLDAMHAIGTMTGKGIFPSAFVRGEMIVRTEYGRIAATANYSTLSELAQHQSGLRKEWSAVIDARTRPTHAAADGQIVHVDNMYSVGGYPALFPHDPALPASETIACRCISVPFNEAWK
jgi:Phage Mu protein F like protein